MADSTDPPATEWQRKGATLSDKTAREEFGLTDAQIRGAIRTGVLQYRVGSMFGNPFLRLLRREVEELVARERGGAYVRDRHARKELARIDQEIARRRREIAALEKRRAQLVGGTGAPPARRLPR